MLIFVKSSIHPEVCFISTCNIGIEYTGTSTLDKALKNRFFPIEFTYLPADIEARVLMKRCDIEKQDADMITSIAAKLVGWQKMQRLQQQYQLEKL